MPTGGGVIRTIIAMPLYAVAILAVGLAVACGYLAYLIEGLE